MGLGAYLYRMLNIFSDYPIKRKPVCFYRQEDFNSIGEFCFRRDEEMKEEEEEENSDHGDDGKGGAEKAETPRSDFYKFNEETHKAFFEIRAKFYQPVDGTTWGMKEILKDYPGWSEITFSYVHNVYLTFCAESNCMMDYRTYINTIQYLGDQSPDDFRKLKFQEADTDKDGWISFDEFMKLVYKFTGGGGKWKGVKIKGLAESCEEAAEACKYVASLPLGEQMQYGLY